MKKNKKENLELKAKSIEFIVDSIIDNKATITIAFCDKKGNLLYSFSPQEVEKGRKLVLHGITYKILLKRM
jgi:hypothetical protein